MRSSWCRECSSTWEWSLADLLGAVLPPCLVAACGVEWQSEMMSWMPGKRPGSAAHHQVREGHLEADGLARQLAEQLLAEHHVLCGLQLLLPVQLHRLAS